MANPTKKWYREDMVARGEDALPEARQIPLQTRSGQMSHTMWSNQTISVRVGEGEEEGSRLHWHGLVVAVGGKLADLAWVPN